MKINEISFKKEDVIICEYGVRIFGNRYPKHRVEVEYTCKTCGSIRFNRLIVLINNNFSEECIFCERKKTSIEKYGVDHYSKNKEALIERNKKLLDRYGVENVSQLEFVKEKRKKNSLEKYGVENPCATEESIAKSIETNLKRYGVKSIFQTEKLREINRKSKSIGLTSKMKHTKREKFLESLRSGRLNNIVKPNFDLMNFNGVTNYYSWRCLSCDSIFKGRVIKGEIPRCKKCYPNKFYTEKEISEWLKSLNIETEESNREIIYPLELDIYIPSKNIAIEYDGLYWHSNEYKEDKYHLKKTELCESKGITLIHIFEDEWLNDNNNTKNRILDVINNNLIEQEIYDRRFYNVNNFTKVEIYEPKKWFIDKVTRIEEERDFWICDCGYFKGELKIEK